MASFGDLFVETDPLLPKDAVLVGNGEGQVSYTIGEYGSVFELRKDGWYRDGVRLEDDDDG